MEEDLQNCDEIPTLDFTNLEEAELEYFVYFITELCEEIATERPVTIKIIKNEN